MNEDEDKEKKAEKKEEIPELEQPPEDLVKAQHDDPFQAAIQQQEQMGKMFEKEGKRNEERLELQRKQLDVLQEIRDEFKILNKTLRGMKK